jgi:hypothetical protein
VKVELMYAAGCPNVDEARRTLDQCMQELAIEAPIVELEGDYASPTLLIEGVDVMGRSDENGAMCRLDLPSRESVLEALGTALAGAVRANGFRLLLASGAPVAVQQLAEVVSAGVRAVRRALDELVRRGSARMDAEGRLVGTGGLSVVPHRHEMLVGARRFWTWCAFDAVGILVALEADGLIRTSDPASGQPIEIPFLNGHATAVSAVLFLPRLDSCSSVVDEWCPNANLFETEANARTWAGRLHVKGDVLSLSQAMEVGAKSWRPLVAPR